MRSSLVLYVAVALAPAFHLLLHLCVVVLGFVDSGCILLLLRLVSLCPGQRQKHRGGLLVLMVLSEEVYLRFAVDPGRVDVSSMRPIDSA